jgi:hypothetical protein
VQWRYQEEILHVRTSRYVVEISWEAGGGILRLSSLPTGQILLDTLSNDLVSYRDSGGLWRMGHEFRGGTFREAALDELAFPGTAPFCAQGALAASPVTVDHPGFEVTPVEPAFRGQGLVARLHTFTTPLPAVTLAVPGRAIETAFLCDARERDLEPLELRDGLVQLLMPGAIATVRLLTISAELVLQR